jgi:hypothetical protein
MALSRPRHLQNCARNFVPEASPHGSRPNAETALRAQADGLEPGVGGCEGHNAFAVEHPATGRCGLIQVTVGLASGMGILSTKRSGCWSRSLPECQYPNLRLRLRENAGRIEFPKLSRSQHDDGDR